MVFVYAYSHIHATVCMCRYKPNMCFMCCMSYTPQAFRVGKAGHLFLDRKLNLPGPEGIVSPANCDLLDGVQRIVDDLWAEFGEEIAGKRGKRACQIQAARDSHPEFPIFSAILSSMPSLGNGPLRHWMCIVQLSVQFIHALTSFVSCVYIANVHRV